MLCRDVIAVCSEMHTEHINVFCGCDGEFSVLNAVVYIRDLLTYVLT
jgi:hypothetical protein